MGQVDFEKLVTVAACSICSVAMTTRDVQAGCRGQWVMNGQLLLRDDEIACRDCADKRK